MLTYPVLEWWFSVVIGLPTIMWIIPITGWIILSIMGWHEIRNAIYAILTAPLGLFLICYVCKAAQELPLLGWFFIIIRFVVDISIIGGIVMIIRYFTIR